MASSRSNGATLGFEETLWQAADKMRGHMDPSEYKHVALGLIFLKYISDAFEERREQIRAELTDSKSAWHTADPAHLERELEDRDAYAMKSIFWVPKEARWTFLQERAKLPEIGKLIDDAMVAIERENPSLKGVLPKDYARPALDKQRLGELVDLISGIDLKPSRPAPLPMGEGGRRPGEGHRGAMDVLGRVYEYFLSQFASKEGKKGGEFYTPRCIVKLLVEMIEPYQGRVYDPCCGSSGMFVQSEEFIRAHGGKIGELSIYGQESNPTTWKLAKMNLAIRGIEANLGGENADSFHNDLHKTLKTDFLLANPPFNDSDWGGDRLREDVRWAYGVPPTGNANFAWVQHFIHHLAPTGIAGFVLANGSMSSNQSGEGDIRKAIVEADLVDCMIALPGQLFYGTQIPACLWFVVRDKSGRPSPGALRHPLPKGEGMQYDDSSLPSTSGRGGERGAFGGECRFRDRRGETLFIDARQMGSMVDRTHRELTDEDVAKIAGTYHAWRTHGPHPASGHPLPTGEGIDAAVLSPSTPGRGARGEGVSTKTSWAIAGLQHSTTSANTATS
jgi:type I restriction enzyme M protein